MPGTVAEPDCVFEGVGLFHEEPVDRDELAGPPGEVHQHSQAKQWADSADQQQFQGAPPDFQPPACRCHTAQCDVNKCRVLFRHHHQRNADGVEREPERVVGRSEIFPQQPQTTKRPEREHAVDQRVLAHVDLRRRHGHERGDTEHRGIAAEPPRERRAQKQRENGEQARHRVQRMKRRPACGRVPEPGAEDIQKARRRQNRARHAALLVNVEFANDRVAGHALGADHVHVVDVERLVEADVLNPVRRIVFLLEPGPGMDAEKNASGKKQHQREESDAARSVGDVHSGAHLKKNRPIHNGQFSSTQTRWKIRCSPDLNREGREVEINRHFWILTLGRFVKKDVCRCGGGL